MKSPSVQSNDTMPLALIERTNRPGSSNHPLKPTDESFARFLKQQQAKGRVRQIAEASLFAEEVPQPVVISLPSETPAFEKQPLRPISIRSHSEPSTRSHLNPEREPFIPSEPDSAEIEHRLIPPMSSPSSKSSESQKDENEESITKSSDMLPLVREDTFSAALPPHLKFLQQDRNKAKIGTKNKVSDVDEPPRTSPAVRPSHGQVSTIGSKPPLLGTIDQDSVKEEASLPAGPPPTDESSSFKQSQIFPTAEDEDIQLETSNEPPVNSQSSHRQVSAITSKSSYVRNLNQDPVQEQATFPGELPPASENIFFEQPHIFTTAKDENGSLEVDGEPTIKSPRPSDDLYELTISNPSSPAYNNMPLCSSDDFMKQCQATLGTFESKWKAAATSVDSSDSDINVSDWVLVSREIPVDSDSPAPQQPTKSSPPPVKTSQQDDIKPILFSQPNIRVPQAMNPNNEESVEQHVLRRGYGYINLRPSILHIFNSQEWELVTSKFGKRAWVLDCPRTESGEKVNEGKWRPCLRYQPN